LRAISVPWIRNFRLNTGWNEPRMIGKLRAPQLFEKGDYPYALFFGHLTIERILKGIYADRHDDVPPFTHRLVYIAEKIPLLTTAEQLKRLEIITDFNVEARYPDEKFSFKRKCTREFTHEYMARIGEVRQWLLEQSQK
jgi:HEPN domain-containing protein